jgi:hypothetical protein
MDVEKTCGLLLVDFEFAQSFNRSRHTSAQSNPIRVVEFRKRLALRLLAL